MKIGLVIVAVAVMAFLAVPAAVEAQAVCTHLFTSGSGATEFTWCLTANGNITDIEAPAGQVHFGFNEGYAICSGGVANGVSYTFFTETFGPPTIVSGCVGGDLPCVIDRDTPAGKFRLRQKFTESRPSRQITIEHTVTNISGSAVDNVTLIRAGFFVIDNDCCDERGDASLRTAWLREHPAGNAITSTASTLTLPASVVVAGGYGDCFPFPLATPTDPGAIAAHITYDLGGIAAGNRKIARVQIRVN